jgi:predicted ATPase/class 3 adenylate cyclase/DNA-binding CsgD family transcriptional regulator
VAERQGLPSGVVTFVLTDIVGSTRLWESVPAAMETALAGHDEILTRAVADHGGVVLKSRGEGDSTFSVFALATDALAAAYAAQVALVAARWPSGAHLAVRFAVHTGEAVERDGDFLGPAVNRAARLRAVANGGEVLVSESTARLVVDRLPRAVRLVELGAVRLRDLDRPEVTYALSGPGLPQCPSGPGRHAGPTSWASSERGVTPKEGEVLELVGEHLTNAEIAARLYVSVRTVESHVSSLLRKFQVTNRHELARLAEQQGGGVSAGVSPPAAARGLPTAATPLVDRADELSKISSLLSRHRLVTLVGPGGTGKTRLATHVATTAGGDDGSESWWAEFASITGGDAVAEVLLASFGVRASSDMDMPDQVAGFLAARTGLLLLDNCEHVREPVAAICERILRLAPSVHILATSREPLGIGGEVLLPVPPLGTPHDDTPETVAGAHAVQLFVDRAQSYSPDFRLGPDNAAAVAELCRSLDGLPLAIELAAARIPTMTPQEIVSRLDRLFRVLGHRSDHIDHHRTLLATLDWSYDLLDPDEKELLSQLAMFAPGFSLAAVEAVSEGTSQDRYALDVLSGLVAKSMVIAETRTGATKLRLLETVRAYGQEKAMETGEEGAARRRQVEFYTRLAEELVGPTVVADIDVRSRQLAAEAANIRLALNYAVDTNDRRAVFDLTAALVDFWCLWGWGGAILTALEAVLDAADPATPGHADALANAAWSAWSQGRHAKAAQWCEESARCSAAAGEPPVPRVQVVLGLVRLLDDRDGPGGVALCDQGLERVRRAGHLRRYAHDLAAYGAYLAVSGELERSAAAAAESVALARRLSDAHTLSVGLNALGYVSIEADAERARAYFEEVVAIGDPWCSASALWGLGWIDDTAGRDRDALCSYREALRLWNDTGDRRGIFYAIEGIAVVVARAGRCAPAVQLFAGAGTIAPDVGSTSIARWNTWRGQHLDMLRAALTPTEFSANWAAGQRLEPDVLVKEALVTAERAEAGG